MLCGKGGLESLIPQFSPTGSVQCLTKFKSKAEAKCIIPRRVEPPEKLAMAMLRSSGRK
jgi:hypothetical protein